MEVQSELQVDPVAELEKWSEKSPDTAPAVVAIQALTLVVKQSQANTLMGLQVEIKAASDLIKQHVEGSMGAISTAAGCELFNQYVTRTTTDIPDFKTCKARLIHRGERFAEASLHKREIISNYFFRFISDDKVILCHGFSRCVLRVLLHAAANGRYFSVIVTESRPDGAGYQMAQELIKANIPVELVLDSAVAHMMENVDLVLLGAVAIVENGGIINKIGTYMVSLVAKALRKPVYVAAESYKFARMYPLGQSDVKDSKTPTPLNAIEGTVVPEQLTVHNPMLDFTPPDYITLLFTDLGAIPPSAVSDELIKFYY